MRIAVTGSTGFIGAYLVSDLTRRGHDVLPVSRLSDMTANTIEPPLAGPFLTKDLQGAEIIIHLAARAHVMRETATRDPLAVFRRANRDATLALARCAAAAKIRRFVFVSTIGVNGSSTSERPFTSRDLPNPRTPYSISKHEAEIGLRQIALETGLSITVVRPVLVCGAGASGNLKRLAKLCSLGLPLPFGSIDNRRALIHVEDLVDLLVLAAESEGQTSLPLLAADREAISTYALVHIIAQEIGRPARLLPVPPSAMRLVGSLTGRAAIVEQLVGSLEVDISDTEAALGWYPKRGARAAVQSFARALYSNACGL